MGEVYQKGKLAKKASYQLLNYTTDEKNEALLLISNQLIEEKDLIIKENKKGVHVHSLLRAIGLQIYTTTF